MNFIKVTAAACVSLISLASVVSAQETKAAARPSPPPCCAKAKAAGKECAHRCCIDAARQGKVCQLCQPTKEQAKAPAKGSH